eukprot:Stramenopile-MAST_4_protein_1671
MSGRPIRAATVGSRPGTTQSGTRTLVSRKSLSPARVRASNEEPSDEGQTDETSPSSRPRRRPTTEGGVPARGVNVNKFLKWNPSKNKGEPQRHLGSSDAHARRQRIARERSKNPAMVDQLLKDLKGELQGRSGQTVEQMRRMMGAASTRSFLQRALFKRVAKAFYHWLCGGVDASLVGRLRTAIEVEKDYTMQLEEEIKFKEAKEEEHKQLTEELQKKHLEHAANHGDVLAQLEEDYKSLNYIVTRTRRKVLRSILRKFIRRESKRAFRHWANKMFGDIANYKKLLRAATWFTQSTTRKMWRTWRIFIRQQHINRRKMLRSSAFMLNKQISLGFYSWQHMTQKRQILRNLLMKIFLKKLKYLRQKSFKFWRDRTVGSEVTVALRAENERLKVALDKMTYAYKHDHLSLQLTHFCLVLRRNHNLAKRRAYHIWQSQMDAHKMATKKQEALLKRGAQKLYRRMLTRDIATWKEYRNRRRSVKTLLKRITRQTIGKFLRLNFAKWQRYCTALRRKEEADNVHRTRLQRIFGRMTNQLQSMAWKTWCLGASNEKRREIILSRATRRIRGRQMASSIGAWVFFTKGRQHKRKKMNMILNRLCMGKVLNGFNSWKLQCSENIRHEVIMMRVANKIKRRELAQAFEGWIGYWDEKIRHKVVLARAAKRMQNRVLARVFSSMNAHRENRKHMRSLAFRVFNRVVNGQLTAGWTSWWIFIGEKRKHEAIIDKIGRKMSNRHKSAAWSAWLGLVVDKKRNRGLLQRAAAKMMSRRLSTSFEGWLDYIEARLRFKVLAFKIFRRLEHAVAMKGMNTWKATINQQKEYERNVKKAVGMWKNKTMGISYRKWKDEAKESAKNKRLLKRFAVKLNRRKLFASWRGWEENIIEIKQNRFKVARCLRKIRNRELAASYGTWEEYYRARLRAKYLAGKVFQRAVNGKLFGAVAAWNDKIAFMRRMDTILKRAAARIRYKTSSAALLSWIALVAQAKHDRYMLKKALSMMRNRIMSASFHTWNEKITLAIVHRRKVAGALHRLQHRVTMVSWDLWIEFLVERRRIKALVRNVVGRLLHSKIQAGWRTWMAYVAMKNRYLYVVARASRRMKNKRLFAAYTSWITLWKDACRTQLILQRCVQKIQNRRKHAVMNAWTDYVDELLRTKRLVAKAGKMWINRELGKTFQGWYGNMIDKIRNRVLLERAARKLQYRTLAASFNGWDEFVNMRVRARFLMSKTLGKLVSGKQGSAFRQWMSVMAVLRWEHELRNLNDDDQKKMREKQRLKQEALEREKREAQRRTRMVKRVLGRVRNRTAGRALDTWYAEVRERQRVRTLLARAAKKMMHRRLYACYDGWREAVVERVLKRVIVQRALKRLRNRNLGAAMFGWSTAVSSIRSNRLKVTRAIKRMRNRIIGKVFDSWVEGLAVKKRNELVVQRCLGKMQNRQMSSTFEGWLNAAEDRIHNRWLVGRILGRLLNGQYHAAFSTWLAKVQSAKRAEAQGEEVDPIVKQMRRVIKRMLHSFISSGWSKWRDCIAAKRRYERIMKRVRVKLVYKLLSASIDGWAAAVKELRRNKALVARAGAKWKNRTLAAVFGRWNDFHIETKENRVKVERFLYRLRNKVVVSSWSTWAEFTSKALRTKHLLARAALKIKHRMAGVVFETWIERVATVKHQRYLLKRAALRMQKKALAGAVLSWDELRMRRKRARFLFQMMGKNNNIRLIRAGWVQWRMWFAKSLKPVGDKFLHALKTCVKIRDKTSSKKLQNSCDIVVEKLRMLLMPASGAEERHKKWLLKREKRWAGRPSPGGIPQWVYKPVAPVWADEVEQDDGVVTDEEADDKALKVALCVDSEDDAICSDDDANAVAAKSLLRETQPRILTPAQVLKRKRKKSEMRKKRRPMPSNPRLGKTDDQTMVITGTLALAEEAARQLGNTDALLQQEILSSRAKEKLARQELEETKMLIAQMQADQSLQKELLMQKAEEGRAKLNNVIENQIRDIQRLQVDYDAALHNLKKAEEMQHVQRRRFELALANKQNMIDHQVEEKRKVEAIVMKIGKRTSEKLEQNVDRAGSTLMRSSRPSSANTTKKTMRKSQNVMSRIILSLDKSQKIRPKSASIGRLKTENSMTPKKRERPSSSKPSHRSKHISPYVLSATGGSELLGDSVSLVAGAGLSISKASDEQVENIERLQYTVDMNLKEEELKGMKKLNTKLFNDIKTLQSDLERSDRLRHEFEKGVNDRIDSICNQARKQLQYQHAKSSSLQATVGSLRRRLAEIGGNESLDDNKPAAHRLMQRNAEDSLIEIGHKTVHKLVDSPPAQAMALNINESTREEKIEQIEGPRAVWNTPKEDYALGLEVKEVNHFEESLDLLSVPLLSPQVQWAHNIKDMKPVSSSVDGTQPFILPSRAMYDSLVLK